MNIDDGWLKEVQKKLQKKKGDNLVVLPWRHGVADSLKNTINFIRQQKDDDFACVTKINNSEYVTIPFALYVKLLEAYKTSESLKEEEL